MGIEELLTYVHPLIGVTPVSAAWSLDRVYLFVTGYSGCGMDPLAIPCLGNCYRTHLLRRL